MIESQFTVTQKIIAIYCFIKVVFSVISYWKLQLPVNCENGLTGNICEVTPITNTYTNKPYFYTSDIDGALVFYAPYNGLTTSGSIHPRSELREQRPNKKYWNVTKVYTSFSATLAVNQLAVLKTGKSSPGY